MRHQFLRRPNAREYNARQDDPRPRQRGRRGLPEHFRRRRLLAEQLEDRRVLAAELDYGDAPDVASGTSAADYRTTAQDGGPSHSIRPDLYLGNRVDGDNGTLQDPNAKADDDSKLLADLAGDFIAGKAAGESVSPIAHSGGTWSYLTSDSFNPSDTNANLKPMVWDTTGNYFEAVDLGSHNDGFNGVYLGFPSNGEIYSHPRRFTPNTVARWTAGPNDAGLVTINGNVGKGDIRGGDGVRFAIYVDGQLQFDQVIAANDGPGIPFELQDVAVGVGSTVDFVVNSNPSNGQYDTTRYGATISLVDDEDGLQDILSDLHLFPSNSASLVVNATNLTDDDATLAGWIDYNGDGVFDNATERATAIVPAGSNNAAIKIVFPAAPNDTVLSTFARFRLSNDADFVTDPQPIGAVDGGEVEDYLIGTDTRIWDGEAGDNDWFNPTNWATLRTDGTIVNSNVVPQPFENALIGEAFADQTIVIGTTSNLRNDIGSLRSAAPLQITERGRLQLTRDSQLAGLTLDGGTNAFGDVVGTTVSGGIKLVIDSDLVWNHGTISRLALTVGGDLIWNTDQPKSLAAGSINVYGDGSTWSGGDVSINGSSIVNRGTFTMKTNADFLPPGPFLPSGTFVNAAGATLIHDAPLVDNETKDFQGKLQNQGSVQVLRGNLDVGKLGGTVTHAGSFVVAADAGLRFTSNSRPTFGPTSSIIAARNSRLTFSTDSASVGGTFDVSGDLTIDGSVGFLDAVTVPNLVFEGNGLSAAQTLTITDQFEFRRGTLSGPGPYVSQGTATLGAGTVPGGITWRARWVNQGDAEWVGRDMGFGGGVIENRGTFLDSSDGSMTIGVFSSGSVQNFGTWTVSDDLGDEVPVRRLVDFTNDGAFNLGASDAVYRSFRQNAGTMMVNDGTFDTQSGELIINGGVVRGSGSIRSGATLGGGTIAPGLDVGTLSFDERLLTTSGEIDVTVSGRPTDGVGADAAGNHFDQLIVGGTFTAADRLSIHVTDDFIPQIGDVYEIIRADTRTSTFSTVTGARIRSGLQWDVSYTPTSVLLTVVPGPDETLAEQLNAGLAKLQTQFPSIGTLFELTSLELPVIDDSLDSLFGLSGASGLLGQNADDFLPVDSGLNSAALIRDAINARDGFQVTCIDGANPCDTNETLRVTYSDTIEGLQSTIEFDDDTLSLLTDLAGAANLDGTLDYDALLSINLTFGLDGVGFFLAPDSEVRLQVTASGGLSTSYDITDFLSIAAAGNATANIDVALIPGSGTTRLRPDDLENLENALNVDASGTAAVTLRQTIQPLDLGFDANWSMDVVGGVTTTNAAVDFPDQDRLLASLIPWVRDQLDTALDPQIGNVFEGFDLPLVDETSGPQPSTGSSGTSAESDFQFPLFVQELLRDLPGLLNSGVEVGEDGELQRLGTGLFYTEGDEILKTHLLRDLDTYALSGNGIKIGVISDGSYGLRGVQKGINAEISPKDVDGTINGTVHVHPTYRGGPIGRSGNGAGAEGTAMIEIIHDIAPQAEIYFAGVGDRISKDSNGIWRRTNIDGEKAFLAGLKWFVENEVNIIVDDISLFDEPFFDDGQSGRNPFQGNIAYEVQKLIKSSTNDILFVSSAGNRNGDHYQRPAKMKRVTDGELGDGLYHLFDEFAVPNAERHRMRITIPPGERLNLALQWDQDYKHPASNLTLALYDAVTGKRLRRSRDVRFPSREADRYVTFKNTRKAKDPNDPVEVANASRDVYVVIKLEGSLNESDPFAPLDPPTLELFAWGLSGDAFGKLNVPGDAIFGHAAVEGVLTVGAFDQADSQTGYPERFSSVGPSTVNPLFGFDVRDSLDVVGPDNVQISGRYKFGNLVNGKRFFTGTSAAAPHLAGLAALLMQLDQDATSQQIVTAIQQTARDVTAAPIAVPDRWYVEGLTGINVIDVLANDIDVDAVFGGLDSRMGLKLIDAKLVDTTLDAVVVVANNHIAYEAPTTGRNTNSVEIEYTIEDHEGNRAKGTLTVLHGLGDAPLAVNDGAVTLVGQSVEIPVLANDQQREGLSLTLYDNDILSANGGIVTFTPDGTLVYEPPAGFTGIDTFQYAVASQGAVDFGTVTVRVIASAIDFVAEQQDDIVIAKRGDHVAVNVVGNDFVLGDVNVSSVTCNGITCTNYGFEEVQNVAFSGGVITFDVNPLETPVSETDVEIEYQIDTPGIITTGKLTVLIENYSTVISGADAKIVTGDEAADIDVLFNDRLQVAGDFQSVATATGATITDVIVNNLSESSALLESMLSITEDGQAIRFNPNADFDRIAAVGSHNDMSVELDESEVSRLGPVEYTAVTPSGHEFQGYLYLLAARPTGLRPATSVDPKSPNNKFSKDLAGYDQRSGYGIPDALEAAYKLLDQNSDEEDDPNDAVPPPSPPDEPASLAAAPSDNPFSLSYTDLLTDLGFTVNSLISTAQIADLLAGRGLVGDLISLTYATDPDDEAIYAADYEVDLSDFGALGAALSEGDMELDLRPNVTLGFGLDASGFFLLPQTTIAGEISGTANVSGEFMGLSASAVGSVVSDAALSLAPLDGDSDGKIRIGEVLPNLGSLNLQVSGIAADLSVELSSELLDYVDVDGITDNNTIGGGDAFRFTASTGLTASLPDGSGGFDFTWTGIRLQNGQGGNGFTSEVLGENLRLLARDVIRGERTTFNNDLLAAFGLESLPLVDPSLVGGNVADGLSVAQTLATAALDATSIVYIVPFSDDVAPGGEDPADDEENDTIEDWLNFGLPSQTQELVRLKLDLGRLALGVSDVLVFDLGSLLPDTVDVDGRAGIESAALTGDLVFGFDTSAIPFYLLTAEDDISAGVSTTFAGSFDLLVNISGEPIGGGLATFENAQASVSPTINVSFPGDPSGKYRLGDDLTPLAQIAVSIDDADWMDLSADRVSLTPGPVTLTGADDGVDDDIAGISGQFNLLTGEIWVTTRRVEGSLDGVLQIEADALSGPALTLHRDPAASSSDPMLTVDGLHGTIDALSSNGITPEFQIPQFEVLHDGSIILPRAIASFGSGFADYIGLAGILPLDLSQLTIDFNDPANLSDFTVGVDGVFDFSSFNLPFDATVTIDGDVQNQFHADINLDAIRVGDIRPVNVGPVTVDLSDFTIPGTSIVMAGQLRIGRIGANGLPEPLPGFDDQVRGYLEVTSGDATYPLGMRIDLAGTLDLFAGGGSLDVDGTAMLSTGGGDAAARFKLMIDATRTENGPLFFDIQVDAQLLEVTLTDLNWDLSPVATIHAGQVQFLPTPGPDGEIANLIDLEMRLLPDGDDEFVTFNIVSAAGFDETPDGELSIDAFSIENASVFFDALSLDGFLDFDDLVISIPNLSNRGGTLIGSIGLAAFGVDILPGHDEFNLSGDLLSGAIDLQTGELEMHAARAELNVGNSLQLVTNDISVHWDPADQSPVLADIGGASIRFPAYPSFPGTDINGLTIRRDGFTLSSFVIDLTETNSPMAPASSPPPDQQSGNPLNPEIHGRVWVDRNENGTRVTVGQSGTEDEGEAGAPGVTVQLFAAADLLTPIDSVVTDGDGQYTFENVPAGDYQIRVLAPVGQPTFYFVPKDQGGFDDYDSDVDVSGFTDVITSGGVTGSDIINKADAGIRWSIERPVIVMPGIMGSYASDIEHDSDLIFRRGVHPSQLTIDPLLHVYDDLIKTLENSGYEQNKDLFVANYDWRNLPAPIDGVIDGVIQLPSATSLTDDVFEYGVDYLGYWMEQASNQWFAKHGVRPDKVDVIVHSTGGIVARSYIQSNVYGEIVDKTVDNQQVNYRLPKIANLVMLGVPNRGASKAWNVLQDNWVTDPSFQVVISKLAQRAYSKLIAPREQNGICPEDPNAPGRCIVYGGNDAITTDDITYAGILDENGQPDPIKFINQYVPTIRALLSTYDFLKPRTVDGEPSRWTTPINQLPEVRNNTILDLNAGLDLLPDVGIADYETINRFAREVDHLVVIAGISEATPTRVEERKGELEHSSLLGEIGDWIFGNIAPLSGGLIEGFFANEPGDQEVWFEDIVAQRGGDETVPSISSIKQFMFDPKVDLVTLARGDQYVDKAPAHTELPSVLASQRKMLEVLGINPDQTQISQQLSTSIDAWNLVRAVFFDPVGGMVLDQYGVPLVGYDADSGTVVESPGTMYLGAEDGIAYLFGDHGDLSLQFTGLPSGGDYFVQSFARGPGLAANQEFRGTLAESEVVTNDFSITEFFSGRSGIPNVVEFEGLRIGGTGISLLVNPDNTVTVNGTLTLDVEDAVLLPDVSTPQLDGLVDVDSLHGSIDLQTGILRLAADNATVTVPDVVTVSAASEVVDQVTLPGIEITLDPNDTSPSSTIASIRNLSLELAALEEVPFDLLDIDLTVRRNGFDLVADVDGQGRAIDIGGSPILLTANDFNLDADLHVTFTDTVESLLPTIQLTGRFRVDATSGTLLPGSPLTASVFDDTPDDNRPGLWGEINLDDRSLSIFVDRLTGGYAGRFGINADNAELHFAPNRNADDPLLSVDEAVVTLSLIDSANVDLIARDITAYSNGDVTVTEASVESSDGIGTSIGLVGLLPVDLTKVAIAAVDQSGEEGNDPILLNSLTSLDSNGNPLPIDVDVQGFFNFDGLNRLPFVPTVQIGGGSDNTFDVTFRKVGNLILPWNTGDISLGLTAAEVFPGFKLDGNLILGGYVNGVWQTDIGGSLLAAINLDDTLQTELTVVIDAGSSLNIDTGTLFLAGTVMLQSALTTPIGGVTATGLELPFTLLLDVDPIPAVPFFEVARFEVSFGDLTVDEIVVDLDGIMTLTARDLNFDVNGSDPDLIATIGEIELDIAALSGLEQTSFVASDAQLFNDRLLINTAELLLSGTIDIGGVDLLAVQDLAVTFTNVGIHFGGANPLTGSPINISDVSGFIGGIDVHLGAGVLMPEIDASLIDYAAIATAGSDVPGLAVVVGLDGFFAPDRTLTIDVDRLGADLFGLLEFEAINGTLNLGPDLSPDDTVFSIATATLALPLFDDNRIELTANDLNVTVGGTVSITSASATVSNGLASAVGLGDILPFDLTAIHIDPVDDDGDMIPDPISLNIVTGGTSIDDLDIRVEGEFDMNALSALPFTPVIAIGDQRASDDPTFDFTFRLQDLDTAAPSIRILDTGAIKFGLEDYQTGPFSIDRAVITLGGFVGGQWVHQYTPDIALSWNGGGVDLSFAATALADLQFSDPVDVGGSTQTVTSIMLDTTIQTSLAGGNLKLDDDDQLVSRDDSAWGFGFENLGIEFGIQFGLLFDSAAGFSLQPVALGQPYLRVDGAGVDQVVADLGGIVRLSAENVNVDFSAFDNSDPDSPVPFLTFGGTRPSRPVPTEEDPYPEVLVDPGDGAISLEFGDADSSDNPLAGLGGTAGNFGIAWDPLSPGDSLRIPFQLVQLPDFFVSVSVPDDFTFGFPDWLPLKISEIGLRFPQTFGDLVPTGDLDSGDPGQLAGFALDALTNVSVIFSGGMESRENGWPIRGLVENMEVDLSALTGCADHLWDRYQSGAYGDQAHTLVRQAFESQNRAGALVAMTALGAEFLSEIGDGTCRFPITDLDAFDIGVEPFKIGPIEIGGGLGFGILDVDTDEDCVPDATTLFGRVEGQIAYSDIGIGVELIVTQYGPVLARLFAGVPIPIGTLVGAIAGSIVPGLGTGVGASLGTQSGFILTGFQGGLVFDGKPLPVVNNTLDLLEDPNIRFPLDISLDDIREAAAVAIRGNVPTWNNGFKFAASGTLTNIHIHGTIGLEVTLGANVGFDLEQLSYVGSEVIGDVVQGEFQSGVDTASQDLFEDGPPLAFQLYGFGALKVLGQSVADAGVMLNFSDPLNPILDIAAKLPAAGGLLATLFPIDGSLAIRLDSKGIVEGSVVAMNTLINKVIGGGAQRFDAILDDIAADLNENRELILSQLLVGTPDPGTTIDGSLLKQGLQSILADGVAALTGGGNPDDISTAIFAATELMQHLSTAMPASVQVVRDLARRYREEEQQVVAAIDAVAEDLQNNGTNRDSALAKILLNTDLTRIELPLFGYRQGLSPTEQSQTIDGTFLVDRFDDLVMALKSPDAANPWIDLALVTLVADQLIERMDAIDDALIPENPNPLEEHLLFGPLLIQANRQVEKFAEAAGIDTAALDDLDPFLEPALLDVAKTLASTRATIQQQLEIALAIGEIFVDASDAAFVDFFEVIDPSLTINGQIQPVLLGMPIGEPTEQIEVRINKHELFFEGKFKVLEKVLAVSPIPIPLTDEIDASVVVPFNNLFGDIFTQGYPSIDVSRDWRATFRGTLKAFGLFDLGDVTGLIFPAVDDGAPIPADHPLSTHVQVVPANTDLSTVTREKNCFGPTPDPCVDPTQKVDKVIVLENELQTLRRNGGVLLDARLTVPEFISDPIAWFTTLQQQAFDVVVQGSDTVFIDENGEPITACTNVVGPQTALNCFLANPTGFIEYFTDVADFVSGLQDDILAERQIAQVQVFIPNFIDELVATIDTTDPTGLLNTLREFLLGNRTLADVSNEINLDPFLDTLLHDTYFRGQLGSVPGGGPFPTTGKILGFDLGGALVEYADPDLNNSDDRERVFRVVPNFEGLQGSFVFSGLDSTFDLGNAPSFPKIGGQISVGNQAGSDPKTGLVDAFASLGFPFGLADWLPGGSGSSLNSVAGATIEAYTPGYSNSSAAPLIRRNGGVAIRDANFRLTDFVDVGFDFQISPSVTGNLIPDFVAAGTIDRLLLPGLEFDASNHPLSLELRHENDALTATLDGSFELFGFEFALPQPVTGSLATAPSPSPLAPLAAAAQSSFELHRDGFSGAIDLSVDGFGVPGVFAVDGSFQLQFDTRTRFAAIAVEGSGTLAGISIAEIRGSFDSQGCFQLTAPLELDLELPGGKCDVVASKPTVFVGIESAVNVPEGTSQTSDTTKVSVTVNAGFLNGNPQTSFKVQVPWSLVPITGSFSTEDYQSLPSDRLLIFDESTLERTIAIEINQDEDYEIPEEFMLRLGTVEILSGTIDLSAGNRESVVRVLNDDEPDVLTFGPLPQTVVWFDFDKPVIDQGLRQDPEYTNQSTEYSGNPLAKEFFRSQITNPNGNSPKGASGTPVAVDQPNVVVTTDFSSAVEFPTFDPADLQRPYLEFTIDTIEYSWMIKGLQFYGFKPNGSQDWELRWSLDDFTDPIYTSAQSNVVTDVPLTDDREWSVHRTPFDILDNSLGEVAHQGYRAVSDPVTFRLVDVSSDVGIPWIIDNLSISGVYGNESTMIMGDLIPDPEINDKLPYDEIIVRGDGTVWIVVKDPGNIDPQRDAILQLDVLGSDPLGTEVVLGDNRPGPSPSDPYSTQINIDGGARTVDLSSIAPYRGDVAVIGDVTVVNVGTWNDGKLTAEVVGRLEAVADKERGTGGDIGAQLDVDSIDAVSSQGGDITSTITTRDIDHDGLSVIAVSKGGRGGRIDSPNSFHIAGGIQSVAANQINLRVVAGGRIESIVAVDDGPDRPARLEGNLTAHSFGVIEADENGSADFVVTATATAEELAGAPAFDEIRVPEGSVPTINLLPGVTPGRIVIIRDSDGDGVSDSTEDDAPNQGDGNLDGIPDRDQVNVTSFPNRNRDRTLTAVVSDEYRLYVPIRWDDLGDDVPAGTLFAEDFFTLFVTSADGESLDQGVDVKWLLDGTDDLTSLFLVKQNALGYVDAVESFRRDSAAGIGLQSLSRDAVTATFKDGLSGDTDGVQDSRIVVFGGFGLADGVPAINPIDRFDVNNDLRTSPLDALSVINALALMQQGTSTSIPAGSHRFLDVSDDGRVSPLDALQVINRLARLQVSSAEAESAISFADSTSEMSWPSRATERDDASEVQWLETTDSLFGSDEDVELLSSTSTTARDASIDDLIDDWIEFKRSEEPDDQRAVDEFLASVPTWDTIRMY